MTLMRNMTTETININGKEYKGRKLNVKAMAYCGRQKTATGGWATVNRTIAVDPNVIPLGSKVYIPQFNIIFVAEDTGSAIKNNKIDIFMNTYKECIQWGIKNILIFVLE